MRYEIATGSTCYKNLPEQQWPELIDLVVPFIDRVLSAWRTPKNRPNIRKIILSQIRDKLDMLIDHTAVNDEVEQGDYVFADGRHYEG